MSKLFAYGTLNDPAVQLTVIGKVLHGKPDTLSGHRTDLRTFVDGTFPVVVKSSSHSVHGFLYEVTDNQLAQCDRYEGSEYTRITVNLTSGETAWVYVTTDYTE